MRGTAAGKGREGRHAPSMSRYRRRSPSSRRLPGGCEARNIKGGSDARDVWLEGVMQAMQYEALQGAQIKEGLGPQIKEGSGPQIKRARGRK